MLDTDRKIPASKSLNEAENRAYNDHRIAQRHHNQSRSSIYSPGTEYLLCQAEVQIMGAVIGVLTESVTESLKGFYKLRKAFLTLDAIMEEEKAYLERVKEKSVNSAVFEQSSSPGQERVIGEPESASDDTPKPNSESEDEFYDVAEVPGEIPVVVKRASTIKSSLSRPGSRLANDFDVMTIKDNDLNHTKQRMRRPSSHVPDGPDEELFSDDIDTFVHSSSNMCYGTLLLMLSLLPPAFSPLIRVAGFKGDRTRGIALLWQASKFDNLNGAFAGLILLGYYNGFIGFCDILSAGAYPEQRCSDLLHTSRKRYPKSCLWMIEATRVISNQKNILGGLDMLEKMPRSDLQQVRALQCFEMAMNYLFVHKYNDCSIAFHKVCRILGPDLYYG